MSVIPCEFWYIFSSSVKKVIDTLISTALIIGGHYNNIKSSNPWTWVSPISLYSLQLLLSVFYSLVAEIFNLGLEVMAQTYNPSYSEDQGRRRKSARPPAQFNNVLSQEKKGGCGCILAPGFTLHEKGKGGSEEGRDERGKKLFLDI